MQIARGIENLPALDKSVVTVGVFDGVHLGHQAIMRLVRSTADDSRSLAVAVTFDRNPKEILQPKYAPHYINTLEQKLELIAWRRMDLALVLEFNHKLAEMSAEDFLIHILLEKLKAETIVIGSNFAFGKGRRGRPALLREMGEKLGFGTIVVPQIVMDGTIISSTEVRRLISSGAVEKAAAMLGHPFVLRGTVVHGDGIGEKLGFPTANLQPAEKQILPARGVYAASVRIGQTRYSAAVNIGTRPTVGGRSLTVEVYILDFSGNIYGEKLDVAFHQRLRSEIQFAVKEDLIKQIEADVVQVQATEGSFCNMVFDTDCQLW
ncbi:MAG: bifunctional riboflavin kinase/FAD synthetase [Armatimonadetes bacterium]|nr:bifunctional riboflavin kinase/FAD synthetase [Armatimonadota bacterium]